ncbi:MAG: hypothetical protein ACR2N4_10345 [Jatrophihabitans sp.]
MIELQPPDGANRPDGAAHTGRISRRGLGWAGGAVLVVVLVAALVNGHRAGAGNNDSAAAVPSQRPTSSVPLPAEPSQPPLPVVACPQIRDEQAHLSYTCIDNDLRQDGSDIYLGLRIALNHQVEPNWVITEGSGNAAPSSTAAPSSNTVVKFQHDPTTASAADVRDTVGKRAALAVGDAYGDNPVARTLSARTRTFAGVPGYELLTLVTINPAYRKANGLKASTERLWVVGLPTLAGVSIFMMSIPDDRSDLWARAEDIVGTVHII